ncbi:MAG: hypothetical protein JXA18_04820 [Chitinispirillaceae bacterium]|nr:hypothetical protein [Chitinispirillaceae bacterium]
MFLTALGLAALMISAAVAADEDPPDKIVRVFYVLPSDVSLDSAYIVGMENIMRESQNYYLDQCGFTFRLNNPIVEVVKSSHPTSWFASVDDYATIIFHGKDEVNEAFPAVKADSRCRRWKTVDYVHAESPHCGGGAQPGWVGLPRHDADGASIYPREKARWCGGMCHELGHLWGLPDATHDDGTVMSADFYHWPVNCILNESQVTTIKNSSANEGFWVTEITRMANGNYLSAKGRREWNILLNEDRLRVEGNLPGVFPFTMCIHDLLGRQAALPTGNQFIGEGNTQAVNLPCLNSGTYICPLENSDRAARKGIVIKSR